MTSKQIMLILSLAWLLGVGLALPGCKEPQRVPTTKSPYETRRVFAVAPFRNESGSAFADGLRVADKITYQLALTRGLDTLPVNRVLAAMQALQIQAISSPHDAMRLRQTLGVDGLVVGTITAYDPYAPMKLGLNLELYLDGRYTGRNEVDPRQLSRASTDERAVLPDGSRSPQSATSGSGGGSGGPVTAIAGFYDAADPNTMDLLRAYAVERAPDGTSNMTVQRHTISIDLFSEFVSYQIIERLMQSERVRQAGPHKDKQVGRDTKWNAPATATTPASPATQAYGHSPLRFEN